MNTPDRRNKRRRPFLVVSTLALLIICVLAVLNHYCKIKYVYVCSVEYVSRYDVVRASGITNASTYFTLRERDIRSGINGNSYLVYQGMKRIWPNQVILYVSERVPCAYLNKSFQYILDQEGIVLEKNTLSKEMEDCVYVTGVFMSGSAYLGSEFPFAQDSQLTAYQAILSELRIQGYEDEIIELNLSDPDAIYMVTANGYTVHIGGSEDVRAKIGTARAVIAKLLEMGYSGGIIEASVPGSATYRPVQ